jgi:hypothetical protein
MSIKKDRIGACPKKERIKRTKRGVRGKRVELKTRMGGDLYMGEKTLLCSEVGVIQK